MLFSSTVFLFLFLPVVLGLSLICGRRLRNAVLLLASLFFYAWGETFLVGLMLVSIAANWAFGLRVERASDERAKKRAVTWAVGFDLGLLVFFKYSSWLWAEVSEFAVRAGFSEAQWQPLGELLFGSNATVLGETLTDDAGGIRLPIGISFFTFQALSYVVDVYRGQARAQKNPLDFAVYISLFPQLIAGPIVRYKDVAAQIAERVVDLEGFSYGIRRFVIGLGKKVLIANVVAIPADALFAEAPSDLSMGAAWLGIVCYALQIYFDFSGYSDMAIGLGRMFGFRFLENFNYPYIAQSITDFWRRWHISLSSWFRDYLYIPLGGNRLGATRTYRNLLLVFFLCGLWHGASFSFVLWGLFHGAFLVLERVGLGSVLERGPRLLRHVYLLLVVLVGWVFFRAENLEHALRYLGAMGGIGAAEHDAGRLARTLNPRLVIAMGAGFLGALPWLPSVLDAWRMRRSDTPRIVEGLLETTSLAAIALILLLCGLQLSAGTYDPFIYFRF